MDARGADAGADDEGAWRLVGAGIGGIHALCRAGGRGDRFRQGGREPAGDPGRQTDGQGARADHRRSEEHTSELQSLMRISYAVFCMKKKTNTHKIFRHTSRGYMM